MSRKERNYKDDININRNDLESEWIEQASLYMHYGLIHAHSMFDRDKAKLKLDWKAADLDAHIREKPYLYGFDGKPTEVAIKSTISRNKDYRKLEKIYIKKVRTANEMLTVKTSFEHRKFALSNNVSLQISGFHSEPQNLIKKAKKKRGDANHTAQKENLNKKGGASEKKVIKKKRKKKKG